MEEPVPETDQGLGLEGGGAEGWRGDGGALVSDRFRSNILTITSF